MRVGNGRQRWRMVIGLWRCWWSDGWRGLRQGHSGSSWWSCWRRWGWGWLRSRCGRDMMDPKHYWIPHAPQHDNCHTTPVDNVKDDRMRDSSHVTDPIRIISYQPTVTAGAGATINSLHNDITHPAAKNEQMCDSSFVTDPDDIQGSSALNDIHWYEQGRANVWLQSNHDRPSRDHLCSDKHIKQRHEQQVQGVQIQSGLSSLYWLYQHTSFPKTVHYQLVTAAVFTKYWVLSTGESRTGD